ncbi:MAG: hypothetical protein N2578_01435, partial [Bdellovibrionaceae bacterium]|nr:hypothetical protein [Pseudobdellovibrionaceae bacterium]
MKNELNRVHFTLILASSAILSLTSCTKPRQAELPTDLAPTIFAISEFGSIDNPGEVKTEDASDLVSKPQRADFEKGVRLVDENGINVNPKLAYMFKNLKIRGSQETLKVVFAVDKKNVTAFKVVDGTESLSRIERALALSREDISLRIEMQKSTSAAQSRQLANRINQLSGKNIEARLSQDRRVYVPLFQFSVLNYGIIEREKNDLKEETSRLRLKPTEFAQATHIQISNRTEDRLMIDSSPQGKEELEQIFVTDSVNNKVMTASQLAELFGVNTNLPPDSQVLTLLDSDSLKIHRIVTNFNELSSAEKRILEKGVANGAVFPCSEDIRRVAKIEKNQNCAVVLEMNYPISYVKPQLPAIDNDGNFTNTLVFRSVNSRDSQSLIRIVRDATPQLARASANKLDPLHFIRISDLRDREFLYRRTLEQSPVGSILVPGMSGDTQIVQFEFEEGKVVVRSTRKFLDYVSE